MIDYPLSPKESKYLKKIKSRIVGEHDRCNKSGYIEADEKIIMCNCMKVFSFIIRLVISRIPETYWPLNVDKFDKLHVKVKKFVEMYKKNFGNALERGLGLFMLGPNGVGKTSIMCDIGKYGIIKQKNVIYLTIQDLVDLSIKKKNPLLSERVENAELILLDELDKLYIKEGSDYAKKELENFLRNVLPRHITVVLATNFFEDEIKKEFGISFWSLLNRHMKKVTIIGEDYSNRLQEQWFEKVRKKRLSYRTKTMLVQAEAFLEEKNNQENQEYDIIP